MPFTSILSAAKEVKTKLLSRIRKNISAPACVPPPPPPQDTLFAIWPDPQPNSPLLSLPGEILDKICGYAIPYDKCIWILPEPQDSKSQKKRKLICGKFRSELQHYFYRCLPSMEGVLEKKSRCAGIKTQAPDDEDDKDAKVVHGNAFSMMLVCKQLYRETALLHYEQNVFVLGNSFEPILYHRDEAPNPNTRALQRFITAVPPQHLAAIRQVRVYNFARPFFWTANNRFDYVLNRPASDQPRDLIHVGDLLAQHFPALEHVRVILKREGLDWDSNYQYPVRLSFNCHNFEVLSNFLRTIMTVEFIDEIFIAADDKLCPIELCRTVRDNVHGARNWYCGLVRKGWQEDGELELRIKDIQANHFEGMMMVKSTSH